MKMGWGVDDTTHTQKYAVKNADRSGLLNAQEAAQVLILCGLGFCVFVLEEQ